MKFFTVSDVARRISDRTGQTIAPQAIANLFYQRKLDDKRCPIIGRARVIPADYIAVIEAGLREHGFLTAIVVAEGVDHA